MSGWTLEFEVDLDTIRDVSRNASHGGSHHPKAAAVATLVEQVQWHAKQLGAPQADGPVDVRVVQRSRTGHHRDSDNVSGPAKAIIDGLVKAGVLVDDCTCHVKDVTLRQHNGQGDVKAGVHVFVVTVTPWKGDG